MGATSQTVQSSTRSFSLAFPRLWLIVILASSWALLEVTSQAFAQTELSAGDLVLPKSGTPGTLPPSIELNTSGDVGLATAGGSAFLKQYREPKLRAARDVTLYRNISPAVTLVITPSGFGSGSLIDGGRILTNWHVVRGNRQVNIIYKPADPFGKPSTLGMTTAEIIKIDSVRDLALLQPLALPSRLVKPIKVAGQDNIEVGADVHAIGHPTGEAWTYTTGIVSQIRPDYEWKGGPNDIQHRATVIQTQTPINPGNSGGPLLADDEQLVGVNSFVAVGAQGLNFAVSARDVRAFLEAPMSQVNIDPQNNCVMFEGRDNEDKAFLRRISTKCDNWVDVAIIVPDDKTKAIMALLDTQRKSKVDGIVLDERRSGKWNTSFWDPKLDETFPLHGLHPKGELLPNSFEPRCRPPSRPLKNFRCS
jgi:S1-C subfamily serine protease